MHQYNYTQSFAYRYRDYDTDNSKYNNVHKIDTLQLFIVKSPISTMSIHIAFKFDAGSASERIEIFSATILHADGHPMTTGSVRWIGIAHE